MRALNSLKRSIKRALNASTKTTEPIEIERTRRSRSSSSASNEIDDLARKIEQKKSLKIGLEIHLQLTKISKKLFSLAKNEHFCSMNTNVHAFDRADPGSLPRLNMECVSSAVKLGVALNAQVQSRSEFDRKHYFYRDLPHGYQITQYRKPVCLGGVIKICGDDFERGDGDGGNGNSDNDVRIERVQIEMDTAKTYSADDDVDDAKTKVDLNRAGACLLEIVTMPDITSEEHAVKTVEGVIGIARFLEISDANLEDGSIRVDVNVSVRDGDKTTDRTEIKNLNSLRSIKNAISFEKNRHFEFLKRGDVVHRETRTWDEKKNETIVLRTKESLLDYRFMREPDVLPIILSEEDIERVRKTVGEMPKQALVRLRNLGISKEQARFLSSHPSSVKYFDDVLSNITESLLMISSSNKDEEENVTIAKSVSNFVCVEIVGVLRDAGVSTKGKPPFLGIEEKTALTPKRVAEVLTLLKNQEMISGRMAKDVLKFLARNDKRAIVDIVDEELGGSLIGSSGDSNNNSSSKSSSEEKDAESLDEICKIVVETLVEEREALKKNPKVFGAFVGEVMKRTKGRADPKLVSSTIKHLLRDYD